MTDDYSVDKTAMLLSTDWFLPHWSLIGIQVGQSSKECFQRGCRDVVLKFIDEAEEYYLINFLESRAEQTRATILPLIDGCHLQGIAKSVIEELVSNKPERQRFYTIAALFMAVIRDLTGDVLLDSQVTDILKKSEIEFNAQWDTDFERLCLNSPTQWDTYIRSLTPEQPTTLCDLVLANLLTSRQLSGILRKLTSAKRSILFSRFKTAAQSLTGSEIEASDWPKF